jgi:hypothetical protein
VKSSLVSDPSFTSAPLTVPLRMSRPVRDSFLTLWPVMRAAAPAVAEDATTRAAAASRTKRVCERLGLMLMSGFLVVCSEWW